MKSVFIYNDAGVSEESYQETLALFNRFNKPVRTVTANILNHEAWEKECALLVIPGGRATPYHELLYPKGVQKILDFVTSGGNYLGLCAGGYYGASHIIFEKGNSDYEIITSQALGLYPGVAEGPAYELGVFRYRSEEGARTALITSEFGDFPAYFNGGCWFHSCEKEVEILAQYVDIEKTPAAIITCHYGKGRVCLSGVHFEYVLDDGHQAQRDNFIKCLLNTYF